MESICLIIPKKKAEPIRRKLMEKGILRKDLQIRSDQKSVFLPITQRIDMGYPIEFGEFKEVEKDITDYRVLVDVPEDVRPMLPSSFDVIGSIAVVKMADEVVKYASEIGKAIIATQKSIGTVCADSGVTDQYRTRDIRVVAGEKVTETVHKEYGMTLVIDVAKVFFSPRLATERECVSKEVVQGETIIDMFAGVGPFSILIAKTRAPKVVYAIDLNPDAVDYLKRNLSLNKVSNVVPIQGDARTAIAKLEKADRIIMNLPHEAHNFLREAVRALKAGGIIHYYEITEESGLVARLDEFADLARSEGRVMREAARRKVKSYSPTMNFYSLELQFL
jgi:tRNA (guanine37-N1)-methyltransferase